MSKTTAMYIRLSMEDEDVSLNQKEESNSVSSQRELLESFIGNHSELKDTKVQEYCDDGFTGTKFERPGYMKLMEEGIILKSVVFWSRYFHFIRYGLLQLMTIMTAITMMVLPVV